MTDDIARLHDLIHERTGLDLNRGPDGGSFAERIADQLKRSRCDSLSDYYSLLRDANTDSEAWTAIVAAFSRPRSSFYRHETHTRVLSEILIPRLLKNRDRLRIWSAGCSTGEEPLMIAMTLSEAGWFDRVPIRIFASDANSGLLAHAQRGIYNAQRVSTLRVDLREKYFMQEEEGWRVSPEMLAKIEYSVASLANEDEITDLAASDVIFCRNVFIYFSDGAIDRTLRVFARYITLGGYLLTDQGEHYERLITATDIFEEEMIDGIVIRKKSG